MFLAVNSHSQRIGQPTGQPTGQPQTSKRIAPSNHECGSNHPTDLNLVAKPMKTRLTEGSGLRRPARWGANLALALVSILVVWTAIDLAAFFAFKIRLPGHAPERFFHRSRLLGHTHRANTRGTWYRYADGSRFEVEVNQHGFADSPREVRGNRPRIALIGDSTTEFWEAAKEDRGQYLLENLLDNRWEVLNFGVRGFGTDQSFLQFSLLGHHFAPEVVVYTFCINDIRDNLTADNRPHFVLDPSQSDGLRLENFPVRAGADWLSGGGRGWLESHSWVFRSLRGRLLPKLARLRGGTPAAVTLDQHFELRPYRRHYDAEDQSGWQITRRLISALDRFTKARGMRLLVVEGIYRPVMQLGSKKSLIRRYGDVFDFGRVTRQLDQHCTAQGIPFLSLPREVSRQQLDPAQLMHSQDSMHLDHRGIVLWAESVAAEIERLTAPPNPAPLK